MTAAGITRQTATFNITKRSYDSVFTNTATKTVTGSRTNAFDSVKSAYDSMGNKTVTVSVRATAAGSNSRTANAVLGLATGGIITSAGLIRSFASGGKIMSSGRSSWWGCVQKYAGGTARAHGTLFVAGEAGAEIVGNIGGRTEVLNKSQIAQAIYNAVLSAGSVLLRGISRIPIDVSIDAGVLSGLSGINYRTPYAASSLTPYEVQARTEASVVGAIESTGDEIMDTIVNAVSAQTASLLQAIERLRGSQSPFRSMSANELIAEVNRQTRMYNASPIMS